MNYLIICCLLTWMVLPGCLGDEEHTEHTEEWAERDRRDTQPSIELKQWKVVTIEQPPYAMRKNGRWVGFIPDLLTKLRWRFGVPFFITEVPDKKYGTMDNETKEWNGMIGELVKKQHDESKGADLAAAPLTITSARERAVNFVKPFQNLGLTILVKKEYLQYQERDMGFAFDILRPLAPPVWGLCILAMFVVAAMLWLINRYNPYEWGGRYNLGRANESQAEAFSLPGSLWFAYATLQWQGYERTPRSLGAKLLSCFWFAFVTLTLITYMGSLVNHLFWASTVHGKSPIKPPIVDLEHLVMGTTDFKYGTIKGSSTYQFFMNAKGLEYEAIRRYFQSEEGQENMVSSFKDGLNKTRSGRYALLVESMMAKHVMNQLPCDLTTVGEQFGSRSYGFALSKAVSNDSLEAFHDAILKLQEEGEIEELERKWWVDNGECYNVTKFEKAVERVTAIYVNQPRQVDLKMFWGPLTLILVGVVLSVLVALGEILYYKYKGRYQDKNRPVGQQLRLDEDGNI